MLHRCLSSLSKNRARTGSAAPRLRSVASAAGPAAAGPLWRSVTALGLAGLALFAPGFASVVVPGSGAPGVAHAATVEVIVTTFEYIPAEVTISEGDSVRWVWDFGTHTVTEGSDCTFEDPLFRVEITPANPIFEFRFENAGVYDYFCEPHCVFQGMEGTVTVLGASSAPENGPENGPGADGNPNAPDADVLRDGSGTRGPSGAIVLGLAARPNPVRESTELRLRLAAEAAAVVEIVNAAGARVRHLASGSIAAGEHTLRWDGRDDLGRSLPAGVYFLRVQAGQESASATVVLAR